MGSTQKMGAGTNVQDRLIASHDIDCPWRPADLEQRAGRIIRQGNLNPKVDIYRYVAENSFDAFLFQTIEAKQRFISQIMTSRTPLRSCEDVDESVLSYAEIKTLCIGDTRIKEKMQLDVDVSRLKLLEASFREQRFILQDRLRKTFLPAIARTEKRIDLLKQDAELSRKTRHEDFRIEICGKVFGGGDSPRRDAGKALITAAANMRYDTVIGRYRGFEMSFYLEPLYNTLYLSLAGATVHNVELGSSASGNITRIENAVNGIPDRLNAEIRKLEEIHNQVKTAEEEIKREFSQMQELRDKSARLAQLNAELTMPNMAKNTEPSNDEDDNTSSKNTTAASDGILFKPLIFKIY